MLLFTVAHHSLRLLLPGKLLRKAHKVIDHTVVIAMVPDACVFRAHHGGEVVSAAIICYLPFGCHIACFNSVVDRMLVTCMCVNWNVLQASRLSTKHFNCEYELEAAVRVRPR